VDELPPTWGLQELHGSRLISMKPATPLEPNPIDRCFLASLLRCAVRQAVAPTEAALEARFREGLQVGTDRGKRDVESAEQRVKNLERSIADFEKASGIAGLEWKGGDVGAAVRILTNRGSLESLVLVLHRLGREAKDLADNVERARVEIEALKGSPS
jgi:hypothetical protein